MNKPQRKESVFLMLLEKGIWGIWFLTILPLVLTGLVTYMTGSALSGFVLLLHVGGGGAFAFFLLAAMVAAFHRGSFFLGRASGAWFLLSALGILGAAVVFSAVINMFPLLGTEMQESLLLVHQFAGFALCVMAPFCYRSFFGKKTGVKA